LEQVADRRRDGFDRACAGFAQQVLKVGEDLFDRVQVGRSGEYFGRKNSLAPAERMSWRKALPLWLPRLSMMTMSPGFKVGTRNKDLLEVGSDREDP
jgi:hypothetical protein